MMKRYRSENSYSRIYLHFSKAKKSFYHEEIRTVLLLTWFTLRPTLNVRVLIHAVQVNAFKMFLNFQYKHFHDSNDMYIASLSFSIITK